METWRSTLDNSSVDTEHKSFVHDVAYDFYGHRMATCSADKEVRVFERRIVDDATAPHASLLSVDDTVGEEAEEPQVEWRRTSAFGHGENKAPVHRISWAHPEFGSIIACASQNMVLVWHETDGIRQESSAAPTGAAAGVLQPAQGAPPWQCVAKLADSAKYVNDVQFAPSHHGLKLATASDDGTIRVYSAPDVLSLRSWHLTTTISAAAMLADAGSVLSISWCTSRFDPPMLAAGLARLSSRGGGGAGAASSASAAAAAASTASGSAVHAVAWAPHCGRSFHAIATASTDGRLRIFHVVAPSSDGALDGAAGGEAASKEGGAGLDGPAGAVSSSGGAALFAIFIFDETTQRYVPGCVLGGGSGGSTSRGDALGASAALQAPLLHTHCVTNEAAKGTAALAWNVLGTTLASSADDGVVRLWSQSDVTFEDDITAATTWTCSAEIHAHE